MGSIGRTYNTWSVCVCCTEQSLWATADVITKGDRHVNMIKVSSLHNTFHTHQFNFGSHNNVSIWT